MKDTTIMPLYQQIESDIKTAIQNGHYKPNEKIPTEPELSAEYSVSRITVRRAIEELCKEGYLIKMQGRGTFVSSPRINRKFTSSKTIESFTELCKEMGMTAGAKLINRQIVPIRQDEKDFFKLDDDDFLVYVQRVRTADYQPIFIENLFLPYKEYKNLLTISLENVSIFETIREISGKIPTGNKRRTLEITKANSEQANLLAIAVAEPLFYLNSYMTDQNQKPLCIGRQYYVGSRYMFEL